MRIRCSILCLLFPLIVTGCQTLRPASVPVSNPIRVQSSNYDLVWEKTVDTLHEYHFEIARENRLSGEIETDYRTGASLLEPWHFDAANLKERTEGTLQSIRRKVLIHVTQIEDGYLVTVEAFKELEDLNGAAPQTAGEATLSDGPALKRDPGLNVSHTSPSGWISKGRDPALEQDFLASLMQNLYDQ